MTINSTLSNDGKTVTISVQGQFDFTTHKSFRAAYQQYAPDLNYVLDLSRTDRVDSSALGMMLLLREHAGGERARIRVQGCSAAIKSVFDVSNFGRLFSIE